MELTRDQILKDAEIILKNNGMFPAKFCRWYMGINVFHALVHDITPLILYIGIPKLYGIPIHHTPDKDSLILYYHDEIIGRVYYL